MYSKKRGTIGENVYSKRRSVSKKRSIPVGGTLGITRTTLGMGLGEMFFLACILQKTFTRERQKSRMKLIYRK